MSAAEWLGGEVEGPLAAEVAAAGQDPNAQWVGCWRRGYPGTLINLHGLFEAGHNVTSCQDSGFSPSQAAAQSAFI